MAPMMRRPADNAAVRLRLPKLKLRRLVAAGAGSGGRDGSETVVESDDDISLPLLLETGW